VMDLKRVARRDPVGLARHYSSTEKWRGRNGGETPTKMLHANVA